MAASDGASRIWPSLAVVGLAAVGVVGLGGRGRLIARVLVLRLIALVVAQVLVAASVAREPRLALFLLGGVFGADYRLTTGTGHVRRLVALLALDYIELDLLRLAH